MPPSRNSESSALVFFTYKRRKVVFARPATHENALNLAKKTFPALKGVSPWKIVIWARLANGREEWVTPEAWLAVTNGVKHFTIEVVEHKVKEEEIEVKIEKEEINVKIEKEEEDEVKMPFHTVQQPGSSAVSPANDQSTVSGTDSAQEIWVHIHSETGVKAIVSKLRPSDSVSKLKTKIRDVMEVPAGRQILLLDGVRLVDEMTLASQSITSGTTLDLFCERTAGKPVIYLYPPTLINAKVRLSLIPGWKFSAVYPQPTEGSFKEGKSTQDVEWDVAVNPSGMIRTKGDSTKVAYLYWEAKTEPANNLPDSPPESPSSFSLQVTPMKALHARAGFVPGTTRCSPVDSVVLPVQEVPPYLEKALTALSLHTEARTSFITYWLPSLLKHEHLALRFIPQADFEATAPLDIDPRPDIVTRVFMLFQGIPTDRLADWEAARERSLADVGFWKRVVGVKEFMQKNENLFRVLEWGGMEVQ